MKIRFGTYGPWFYHQTFEENWARYLCSKEYAKKVLFSLIVRSKHRTKDCLLYGYGCIVMQEKIVQKCQWFSFRNNELYFDKNGNTLTAKECQRKVLCILILNVDTYANVILERSLLTIRKQIWTHMNGYFL